MRFILSDLRECLFELDHVIWKPFLKVRHICKSLYDRTSRSSPSLVPVARIKTVIPLYCQICPASASVLYIQAEPLTKSSVFWDITACHAIRWKSTDVSEEYVATCFVLVSSLAYSSTLRMWAIFSSETSIGFQHVTQRYVPEDRNIHRNHCGSPKSCTQHLPVQIVRFSFRMQTSYYYYYYYCSTALHWALAAVSVSWSHAQSVWFLRRGIRPSQGRCLQK
jgi:hypothetical protein